MQIGRFFSLGNGTVGQFLSPRVLVVRSPFQTHSTTRHAHEFCCLGFDTLGHAQRFIQSLSRQGLRFKLRPSQVLSNCPYEVVIWGNTALAQKLAFWDRRDRQQFHLSTKAPPTRLKSPALSPEMPPAIAA